MAATYRVVCDVPRPPGEPDPPEGSMAALPHLVVLGDFEAANPDDAIEAAALKHSVAGRISAVPITYWTERSVEIGSTPTATVKPITGSAVPGGVPPDDDPEQSE